MKLYLVSAYKSHECLEHVRNLSRLDANGQFRIAADPESADAIVFVENTQFDDIGFKAVLSHPLVRQYPDKVSMYNEADRAWPVLHGLYCSLACDLADSSSQVAFPYLTATNSGVRGIYGRKTVRKWLYSFVGSQSHVNRRSLLSLNDDRGRIVDTSDFCTWNPMQTSKFAFQKLYTDTMAASKFILCPRGIGPASLRLFESIEAGRVPVIISDKWVAPPQIDWDFAVRIPEWQVHRIPEILTELEPEWQDRGEAARKAWESAYAPDQMFNTLGQAIQGLQRTSEFPRLSWQARKTQLRVTAEQFLRNQLKPPVARPPAPPARPLGKQYSRKI